MDRTAGKLWGLRRIADAGGRFKMVAVDQRPPIVNAIKDKLGVAEAPYDDVAAFKALLVRALQDQASALLLDPHYAYPRGIRWLSPTKGLILTLEDSRFEDTSEGRVSRPIDGWTVGKIKRIGGDAVKLLAWYRPDAGPGVRAAQQDFVARIGDACRRFDIPFVFELLIYPLAGDADSTTADQEMSGRRAEHVVDSVRGFADDRFGVDVFKLESPVAAADVPAVGGAGSEDAQRWFSALDEAAGRPWVMLSAGAGMAAFRDVLAHAYRAGASGYLAGRAIWLDAFAHYPDWSAIETALASAAIGYMRDINRLTDEAATPWFEHPAHGGGLAPAPDDGSFRHHYADFA